LYCGAAALGKSVRERFEGAIRVVIAEESLRGRLARLARTGESGAIHQLLQFISDAPSFQGFADPREPERVGRDAGPDLGSIFETRAEPPDPSSPFFRAQHP
jgi:hypothetical protein